MLTRLRSEIETDYEYDFEDLRGAMGTLSDGSAVRPLYVTTPGGVSYLAEMKEAVLSTTGS